MIDSKLLDELLNDYSVNREVLKHKTTKDHGNEIAKRIGAQWESLATFIGVCDEEVHDIKEKYNEPLDMRLAIMRRWNELWGREATYLKLVEGLMQVGRRDLIEVVLQWRKRETQSNVQRQNHISLILAIVICCLVVIMLRVPESLLMNGYLGKHTFSANHSCISCSEHIKHSGSCVVPAYYGDGRCNITVLTNGDLPIRHEEIFVGRESDVLEVVSRVARKNIVNINGAPGFGKSALAKHVGQEILRNGTLVQYFNIEENFSLFKKALKAADSKVKSKSLKRSQKIPETQYLVKLGDYSSEISNYYNVMYSSENQHHQFIDELINWSEGINCYTVLILDNCDDILVSSIDEKFNDLIKSLVRKSKFNLHIIITSRLKLLYLDWFDCWTVKELNVSASIQLLDKIAPGIGDNNLTEIAEVVEGCPLALKVIGQLLHIHGAELTHSLKKDLMTNLEKASDKRERFPLIMDIAFSRLGMFKECGYSLSLFPGSFDKSAANAVVPSQEKECIDSYVRHSLVDEYFIPHQHRYQMHSLISTYFKAKALQNITTFEKKFRDYFVHFVLKYSVKLELDSIEMDILSSELHNLHYLRTILLRNRNFSAAELAALAYLVNVQHLIHIIDLKIYYPLYMKKINDICTNLNPKSCWQIYLQIFVIHSYLLCKCPITSKAECLVACWKSCATCISHCETLKYIHELQETIDADQVLQAEFEIIIQNLKLFLSLFCSPWYEVLTVNNVILYFSMVLRSPEKHMLEIGSMISVLPLTVRLQLLLDKIQPLHACMCMSLATVSVPWLLYSIVHLEVVGLVMKEAIYNINIVYTIIITVSIPIIILDITTFIKKIFSFLYYLIRLLCRLD